MKKINLLFSMILLISSNFILAQKIKILSKGDSLFNDYLVTFKPSYYKNGDSLVVACLPNVSSELNSYINSSITNKDFSCIKYIYPILVKLTDEHSKINKTSYPVDSETRENEIIRYLLTFMKEYTDVDTEIFYFELSNWMYKNRNKIKDLKKVKRYYL